MKLRMALVALLLVVGLNQFAEAQLTQIRRDYRQPMTYSPADPFSKGLVYRLQTGQAGKYFNCDGEEEKRYSPYIYWTTVCNHTHPKTYCSVMLRDLHEVKERVRAGACRGGQYCTCGQCQQPAGNMYLAENNAAQMGQPAQSAPEAAQTGPAEVANSAAPATSPESQHVVYGSRASRQRAAQQGSFVTPETERQAAEPVRSAEQSPSRTRR